MTRTTGPGDETGLLAPQAAADTVTAMSPRTATSPDHPDDAARGRAGHNEAQADKVRRMKSPKPAPVSPETVEQQGPLSWPRVLLVLAALFVVLVTSAKFVGVWPTLIGLVGTVVLVYVGLSMRTQPKDPSKDLVTLTGQMRDVLVAWMRKPAP